MFFSDLDGLSKSNNVFKKLYLECKIDNNTLDYFHTILSEFLFYIKYI